MKIRIFTLFICCAISLQIAVAQGNNTQKREKVKAMKVGFITEQLDLTVEESQKFWPVYNEFEGKREKIREEQHDLMRKFKQNSETLTEVELNKMAEDIVAKEQAEAKLVQEYLLRFKAVLPVKKVVALYAAEKQFNNHLLKQLRNRGQNGQGKGKGSGNDNQEPEEGF